MVWQDLICLFGFLCQQAFLPENKIYEMKNVWEYPFMLVLGWESQWTIYLNLFASR